ELGSEDINLRSVSGFRENHVGEIAQVKDEVVGQRRAESVSCSNDDIVRAVRHELVVRFKNSRRGLTRNYAGPRGEWHVLTIVVERIPTLNISRGAHYPVDFRGEQLFVERVRGKARGAWRLSRVMERRAVLIIPLVVEKEKELVVDYRSTDGAAVL